MLLQCCILLLFHLFDLRKSPIPFLFFCSIVFFHWNTSSLTSLELRMASGNHEFVEWEERIISQEKGHRLVHYYLKDFTGESMLAVVGTERSIRHMIYVVSEDYLDAFGHTRTINSGTKWRARREVVEWLTFMVSKHQLSSPISNTMTSNTRSPLMAGLPNRGIHIAHEDERSRKLKAIESDILWSGTAWTCSKQFKHYPSVCRNGTAIAVHSIAKVMGEDESHYLGYLEDLYENKKGEKKAKVQWFHQFQEVQCVIPQLEGHPREVFITSHVQVINAECIDRLAIVLTPKDYEKYLSFVPRKLFSAVYMCNREFRNNKVMPFSPSKLNGYYNQVIFTMVRSQKASLLKSKGHTLQELKETHEDPARQGPQRIRSVREYEKLESSHSGIRKSIPRNQVEKPETTCQKLKIKVSNGGTAGIQVVGPKAQGQLYFEVGDNIEFLCQDSGMRGCWFRCKVLQVSQKRLKVQYDDIEDSDNPGKLEEWIPSSRVAEADKLGMRCTGRLTVRPRPPEDPYKHSFEVGAAVDAWWCDGWWEGVVAGLSAFGSGHLQVYFPGENKLLELQMENVRISRDWIENKWAEVKGKPDIKSFISSSISEHSSIKELGNCKNVMDPKLVAAEDKMLESTSKQTTEKQNSNVLKLKRRWCNEYFEGKK